MPERPTPITEPAATLVLIAATVGLAWIVPDNPLAHLGEPPYLAVVGYGLTLVTLAALRPRAARAYPHERFVLTMFLLGMPVIYVASCLLHSAGWPWLLLELGGLGIYGALAALGRTRSFALVVIGIAAHGVWDLAHYGRTDYIPDWYTVGCAVIDFSLGLYLWSRLSRPGYARASAASSCG